MANKIKGKDCALEGSIERFEAFFDRVDVHPVVDSWLNPVCHVWSVHVKCKECPTLFTNGKGGSKQAALASAYGEFVERLLSLYFFADYYWDVDTLEEYAWYHHPNEKWVEVSEEIPHSILSRSLERFYVQEGEVNLSMLLDLNMGHQGVCCVPYRRERDGKEVFIPQNIIANLYVSNGMSCGNSEYEAKVQALSEIIERGVKNKIISEGIALPTIEKKFLEQFPSILEGIEELGQGVFTVVVKDASLGGKYPVVNITLINKQDGGVFCAFGSHPIFEVALERTLTELLQGRDLDHLQDFKIPQSDLEYVSSSHNLEEHFIDSAGVVSWRFFAQEADYPFVPWGGEKGETTTLHQWESLVTTLQQDSYEIYIADYSYLGEHVYRIIVPGFSEIYPLEELYLNNNSEALPILNPFLNLHEVDQERAREMLHSLNELTVSSFDPLAEFLGLLFEEDTFWSDMCVGHLRTLLHIVLGELEIAYEELTMLPDNNLFWTAVISYLEIKVLDAEIEVEALDLVYGKERVKIIKEVVEKQELRSLPSFEWKTYRKMMNVWKKVHKKSLQ